MWLVKVTKIDTIHAAHSWKKLHNQQERLGGFKSITQAGQILL